MFHIGCAVLHALPGSRAMHVWITASLLPVSAPSYVLNVPVDTTLVGTDYLDWDTDASTLDEFVDGLRTGKASEGTYLACSMEPLIELQANTLRVIRSESQKTWVTWTQLAGFLHMLVGEYVQPTESVFQIEEAPFDVADRYRSIVGVFLLQMIGRVAWRVIATAFQEAWTQNALDGVSLHLLIHQVGERSSEKWRTALSDAWPLLRGMHWCGGRNRFSALNPKLVLARPRDNYYHKVFTMFALTQYHDYEYMVSMDDDVLLPPSGLATLVKSGPIADAHGCGVVSPILQNGVPSTDIWAESFLSSEEKSILFDCFSLSSARYVGNLHAELEPLPRPWNSFEWYNKVRHAAKANDYAHQGLHPVRSNDTCMQLALYMALEPTRLSSIWSQWRIDQTLLVDRASTFPYFCNNAYLIRSSLYGEVVKHPYLHRGGADEEKLNVVLAERDLPMCFTPGSFGIHPAYSTHSQAVGMELTAVTILQEMLRP